MIICIISMLGVSGPLSRLDSGKSAVAVSCPAQCLTRSRHSKSIFRMSKSATGPAAQRSAMEPTEAPPSGFRCGRGGDTVFRFWRNRQSPCSATLHLILAKRPRSDMFCDSGAVRLEANDFTSVNLRVLSCKPPTVQREGKGCGWSSPCDKISTRTKADHNLRVFSTGSAKC